MNIRNIPVTAPQVDELMALLRAVPAEPVGACLAGEAFTGYARETLSQAEVTRLEAHLASCADCLRTMERVLDVVDTLPWLQMLAMASGAVAHLAYTRRKRMRFEADPWEPLFQHWTVDADISCSLQEEATRGFLFTVDTRDAARQGALVRFTLSDAQTGDEAVGGLLVLHADPYNDGHYVGTARLADDVPLPAHCQPHLDFMALDATHRPDRAVLLVAAAAAVEAADRRAWHAWAQREAQGGRLPQDIAEAIGALCVPDSPLRPRTSFVTSQQVHVGGWAAA